MRNPLSKTITTIQPSGIRKFFDIVHEMKDAISLGVGEPDFDTPWRIREEGIYTLEQGKTFYTSNAGLKDLKIPSMGNGYLMAEWHFYAAGPSKSNDKKRWTTGTEEERQKIKKSIKVAVDWQKKTGIYTWVGAWMPGDYNKGDNYSVKEQTGFASFMTQQLDKYGIPFAINADDRFYDYQAENWIPKYKDLLNRIFM